MIRAGWRTLAVLALLWTAGLAWAAPAPDEAEALKKKALALNDLTGEDAIKGQVKALVKDEAGTKKLLTAAAAMAKEKEQPFNYNATIVLAQAAHLLKAYDHAETFYKLGSEQAIKLKSGAKITETLGGLIDLLYSTKKYDECEKLCKEFLSIEGDPTVQKVKGMVLRKVVQAQAKQGKFDDANKLVDALLKAQPDNWLTLELKGWVQREAGEPDASAKTYEEVLDKINKDEDLKKEEKAELAADIRYTLSGVYVDAKNIDKASEHLESLLKEEPDNPTYNNDLGYIWADHDRNLEKAEKLIRKALEEDRKLQKKMNPDIKEEEIKENPAYLDSLGWVLFKLKKYKDAKEPMVKAVKEKDGQHLEIFDHLGDIQMALGEKKEAVETWKKGLEFAGDTKRDKARKAEVEKKIKDAEK